MKTTMMMMMMAEHQKRKYTYKGEDGVGEQNIVTSIKFIT